MSYQSFNPQLLKAGDYSQLDNWMYGKGNSIHVSSVPSFMTEEDARYYFGFLGKISRIDFVAHKVGTGRMMFLHFHEWYEDLYCIRNSIATAYPSGYNLHIHPNFGYMLCYINTNPIPVVEYNIHQLSDMFASLKQGLQSEVLSLRQEVAELRQDLEEKDKFIRHISRDLYDVMKEMKFFDDDDDDFFDDDQELTEQQKSAIRKNIQCAERHLEA